jgi:Na+/H+ antiporter NhaA
MSLFIGTLAFPAEAYDIDIRIAVLLASVISAACGYLVLRHPRQGRSPAQRIAE